MIQLDRIQRRFGARVLFEGLSWLVTRDARIGLVGPNGAGKTTILRLLAGLDAPDAGEVRRTGNPTVGYLPQEVETLGRGSVLASVLDGFTDLRRLEERLEELETMLAGLAPGHPDLERTVAAYGEVRHEFESLGGDTVEARAKAILTGLGVDQDRLHEPLARLSGGWRMRVVLARLLLASPDLLLLDEPTNHLDLDALAWLESFLEGWVGAFVVVSHDRYFLNKMVRSIAELDRGRLTVFHGGYDDYLGERERRDLALEEAAAGQIRERARVERFIARFRYKASKARQVQSRIRALDKVERIEAPSASKRIRFGFAASPRSGDLVARLEGVRKAFGPTVVFDGADFVLRRGDRVALVGRNGSGKSTLLGLLCGAVAPDEGDVAIGHNVRTSRFAQHQLELLDPGSTVLEELERAAGGQTRERLRALLGCFLFSGDDVDKKVAVLSGGEKARLALARMLVRPSNLMLLDEPTNHLDLRSREVLEEALDEYDGTLVVVSHDRYFINRVATSVAAIGGGRIESEPGDYDAFVERAEGRGGDLSPAVPDREAERRRVREREERHVAAQERNRRYRERKALESALAPLEAEIERLEVRIAELDRAQADPDVYRDPDRAREVGRERTRAEQQLAILYARWDDEARRFSP